MKIEARLDYSTILGNQARPVHLALRFEAPASTEADSTPRRPMAFCAVLDRSGSMGGAPLHHAREACRGVITNLRPGDLFALVTFDESAEVIIPLQRIDDRPAALGAIDRIRARGSTNLTAGWMLGRDELNKSPDDVTRRLLLLSDGELNRGIVDPAEITRIVADGQERSRVRTSTLGFGQDYNEDLLGQLATSSGGIFYDANSPEKLPAIFKAELDGLQRIAVQNLRFRVEPLAFCESWSLLASYPAVKLPDGRIEISLGDLVSEESATVVLELEVLPLPLLPGGEPVTTLEGEALLGLEILWDDLAGPEVRSLTHLQTVRILPTQDPADVIVNEDVIPAIAAQRAGFASDAAVDAAKRGETGEAEAILLHALDRLSNLGSEAKAADGIAVILDLLRCIREEVHLSVNTSKSARYRSSHLRKMKSLSLWTLDEPAPFFSKNTSADPDDPFLHFQPGPDPGPENP